MTTKLKDKDISETEAQGKYVINQKNVLEFLRTNKNAEKQLLHLGTQWHKIIVHNVINNNREIVLKDLLNAVHPCDLIPVNFKIEGKNANFIARNCGPAILKMCEDNLLIRSNSTNETYVLTIILGFSNTTKTQLNVQSNIQGTINKRYNSNTKTLNLDSFHKDSELSELIFCILSQPKILYFVLHLAKPLQLQSLKLSNNEIRNLSPLELLWSNKSLSSIDLRNNSIEDISVLKPLKNMKITEIWLDGNPVCNNFEGNETEYIEMIKDFCPLIEKIDGTVVNSKGFLAYRRNYLVNNDCQQVVDQFLSHYFTLYDSPNRHFLEGIYAKNAIFTISCAYLHDQSTSYNVHLENYKKYSRNLKTMSDVSKSCQELMYGPEIIKRLSKLPPSEHDPFTFTVDVTYFSNKSIALVVTGAFREAPTSLNSTEPIYGFSRTFVLSQFENNEYKLVNDMVHITNATTSLANRSFKIIKSPEMNNVGQNPNLTILEPSDKNDFVQAFSKITTLNKFWARKCLEDAKWDFKNAMLMFVELYKSEKFTSSAFKTPLDFM